MENVHDCLDGNQPGRKMWDTYNVIFNVIVDHARERGAP
jgi:hypothetical protein